MHIHTRILASSLFVFTAFSAHAAKDADIKPALSTAGKVLFESAFDTSSLDKPWSMPKGEWAVKDGAVVGKEKASDMHAAVLALGLPARNSITRFSFKTDAAKLFNVSFNYAKGHLFRVAVTPQSIALNKDKDKKDEASKGAVLGKADAKFAPGEWHTMLVEIKGTKVTVQTDNGAKVEVSDPSLDVDKTSTRFVMRGESLLLDDVRVWEVAP